MILVTGATGNVGGGVVRLLAEGSELVRALVRGEATLPDGVQAAVGDLGDVETMTSAMQGARAIFMLSGYPHREALFARARESDVEHVVLLSAASAEGGDPANAVARYHMDTEADLRASGLGWTILRPNTFMSNALRWRPQLEDGDVVSVPFADVGVAANDPLDIAAVAAGALRDPSAHADRIHRISGPELLRPADQVATLGDVLGRALTLRPQGDAEARAEMEAAMPLEYVDAFFAFFRGGELDESQVRPTVRDVTGREPRTFRQWAEANTERFKPSSE